VTNPTQNQKTRHVPITVLTSAGRSQPASSPVTGAPGNVRRRGIRIEYPDFRTGELHIVPPSAFSSGLPLRASPETDVSPIKRNLAAPAPFRRPDAPVFARESQARGNDVEVTKGHARNSAKAGVDGAPLQHATNATSPKKIAYNGQHAEAHDAHLSRNGLDAKKKNLGTDGNQKQLHEEHSGVAVSPFSDDRTVSAAAAQTHSSPLNESRFMRLPEVLGVTGLSRSSLYAAIARGKFPSQARLLDCGRAVGWIAGEVHEWVTSRSFSRGTAASTARERADISSTSESSQLQLPL